MATPGTSTNTSNENQTMVLITDIPVLAPNDKLLQLTQFLQKHNIVKSKRKMRDLMLLPDIALEGYKSNIIISSCCKVCILSYSVIRHFYK